MDSALPLAKVIPIQYQTFLPLPNSPGANPFDFNSLSSSVNLGPSFQSIENGSFNFLKKLYAFLYSS